MKMQKVVGAVVTLAVAGVFAVGLVRMVRGQGGELGPGGIGVGEGRPRTYFSICTNSLQTNSPGQAAPGSIWFQAWITNSVTNFVVNTAWTNSAGTNYNTVWTTGVVVTASACTGVNMRVQVGGIGVTSVWFGVQSWQSTNGVLVLPTLTP